MLRRYIRDLYHGRLIHSTEFLSLYFKAFPKVFGNNGGDHWVDKICSEWLDTPAIPKELKVRMDRFFKKLTPNLLSTVEFWKKHNPRKRPTKATENSVPLKVANLRSEQLVVVLEKLLQQDKVFTKAKLSAMDTVYNFKDQNPDVQHRWCELIVMSGVTDQVEFIKSFLVDHQSMGVYLYGELASTELKIFQDAALSVFKLLETEMDPTMKVNVSNLLGNC